MRGKRIWSVLLLALITGGIVLYLKKQPELLVRMTAVPTSLLVYLIILRLLFLATSGLYTRLFAKKLGIHLAIKEWFGLAIITAMGNYLTPLSGGMVARGAYLKRRHALPYSQFLILLASNYFIILGLAGLIGVMLTIPFLSIIPSASSHRGHSSLE